MPIYEFYCSDCNTLFNFFSAAVDTEARPDCPKCGRREIERRPASFATLKHRGAEEPTALDDLDEEKMESAMEVMMQEMGDLEQGEDPRKLAGALRRFGELSGLELGPQMEEMIGRLEAGEDPDEIEADMGGLDDPDDDSLDELFKLKKAVGEYRRRPEVDTDLYFL